MQIQYKTTTGIYTIYVALTVAAARITSLLRAGATIVKVKDK